MEQINESTERQAGNTVGKNIVTLLNSLANTTVSSVDAPHNAWSTTTEINMAQLYTNFTQISVGSSSSLAVILSRLYASLGHIQSTHRIEKGYCRSHHAEGQTYGQCDNQRDTTRTALAVNLGLDALDLVHPPVCLQQESRVVFYRRPVCAKEIVNLFHN